MPAVILSIGSELVSGLRLDTHARDLARTLRRLGIDVVRHETLDDDIAAIADAFTRGAASAEVVLATGGLGPTPDDVTRDGLARAMNADLEAHPEARRLVDAWAASRGRTLSGSNLRQAVLPRGAEPIPNPVGSAPGIRTRLGRADVFCMPGVPDEMRRMLRDQVLPHLEVGHGAVVRVRTVRTFGLPESQVGERLSDLMARGRRPQVATACHVGRIDIHIHAAGLETEVERLLEADAAEVRRRLGDVCYAEGETSMEAVVAERLAATGATLAVAESCTGGLVAAALVSVPGMSAHLLEAVVAYADEAKTRRLDVPADVIAAEGAVSEAVARAMAEGARRQADADLAVAVTGIAGPGGGTEAKPVGLVWFAIVDAAGTEAARHVFPGGRQGVRERATLMALNLVRLRLSDGGAGGLDGP